MFRNPRLFSAHAQLSRFQYMAAAATYDLQSYLCFRIFLTPLIQSYSMTLEVNQYPVTKNNLFLNLGHHWETFLINWGILFLWLNSLKWRIFRRIYMYFLMLLVANLQISQILNIHHQLSSDKCWKFFKVIAVNGAKIHHKILGRFF